MVGDDWYRRKTWTPKDREEFFARLRRSKDAFHKAQYARIQAGELQVLATREAFKAALELLDMILAEWREEAQLASVYHQRAACLAGLGDLHGAVDDYRRAFATQRVQKGEFTNAHVDFAWLAATTPMPELYDEALAVLAEFDSLQFPVLRYQASAVHALICAARGQMAEARSRARDALREAGVRHSGFRYHGTLGLVESPDEKVHKTLQTLAT